MAENANHESQTYPERSQRVTHPQSPTTLIINGVERQLVVGRNESLLHALRRHSYRSVKMGCNTGDCGVCTVLLDGRPVRSCMTRAVAADGHTVTTVEGLAPSDPIMQAFMEVGAIQCGYCTPAQILVAKALLESNPTPSESEVREAMSGVLCRCTGYVRVVDAVLRAAALLRGEAMDPFTHLERFLEDRAALPEAFYRRDGGDGPLPPLVLTPAEMEPTRVVGQPQVKVDA
ncbi:MAG: (2Fe-2S)-binding protein [Ardenticatenia bacterium]|nr:(2Fe-2S)-binding protein [Ardenticatenia bacterium]